MTLGQMASEIVLGASAAADQDFTCTPPNGPPCRWGDYAGASPDPTDDHVVWGSNQINGPFTSDPHWQTRNFAVLEGTSPGYARPQGATPLRVSLVPAYVQCTGGNRMHGGPLAVTSCNPPAQSSGFLTVGTLDANGMTANAVASVRVDAIQGDIATPADEADLRLRLNATDVRRKTGLTDYTGELLASTTLRMTDRNNGPSQTEPATGVDLDYTFPASCQATASTDVGSTCAVVTTADSLVPGTVLESKRSNWQLGQVRVFDGGPDGVALTADNTLFEIQGIFVP